MPETLPAVSPDPRAMPDERELDDCLDRTRPLIALIARSPVSLTAVSDPAEAERVHLLDSLSGLGVGCVRSARRVVDIGSGAGLPGLPLAAALPEARFTLIDSVGRKARFIESAARELGLANVEAVTTRSEELAAGEGAEAFDLALARAVAPLSVLAELASPLLAEGGHLVAWKGEREPEEEARLAILSDRLAMELEQVVAVEPFEGSRERHLYVVRKSGPTPPGLPRRPGMARKRPLSE